MEEQIFADDLGEFEYTEIPIDFNQEKGSFPIAFINVITGDVELKIPIDTGHGLSGILLSPTVLSKLPVKFTGKTQENYDAFGKRYISRQFVLPNLKIGDLSLRQVIGHELFTKWDDPAYIGLPFLRHFNILIDYPSKRFGLYNKHILPEYLAMPVWLKAKMDPHSVGLVLSVKFKNYEEIFRLCLDTGATSIGADQKHYSIVISEMPLGKLLREKEAIQPGDEPDVLGKISSDQFRLADGGNLPKMDFVIVNSEYLKIDGLLGHSFFAENSVFIDFGKLEIHVKPC